MNKVAQSTSYNVAPTTWFGKLDAEYLILYKLLYFMLNWCIYSIHTLQVPFFVRVWGIKVHEFGYVSSLLGFNFVGALFWAHIADKTGQYKTILISASVVFAISACALQVHFTNLSHMATIIYTGTFFAILNFFSSAMFPLLDNLVLTMLSNRPGFSKEIFGRQRMFGSFGHGTASVVSSGFNTIFLWALPGRVNEYTGMFVFLSICCAIFSFLVYVTIPSGLKPIKGHGHHGHGASEKKPNEKDGAQTIVDMNNQTSAKQGNPISRLIFNPHFMFFMAVIMCAGYVRSIMSNFQGYFSQECMKLSQFWVSALNVFRTISEVAVFLCAKQLMAWTGIYWMLVLSQLAGILRVLGYGFFVMDSMAHYPLNVCLELLKGLNSGLIVSSGVRLASDIAPRDCGNTAQALFSGVYSGLSTAVAGIIGGLLIYYDPATTEIGRIRGMFANTGYAATIFLILFTLKYGAMDRVMSLPMLPKKYDHPVGSATH